MIGKRLLCLLGSLNLIITPVSAITTTPPSVRIIETQIDNNVVNKNVLEIKKHPIFEKLEKDKIEFEQKKAEEERLRKEQELEEQKKNEPVWQEFELTFYSSLPEENSGSGTKSVTCTGGKLYGGIVASNYYKLNTKIQLEGWGTVTVGDRGSDKYFNNDYRLDVYIPKESCESDSQYFKRVNNMGRIKVKGYIVK
jgi:3D (Asp-Asp-Asp) domain-containing protein